ncbi:MAG: hypothetical protein WCN98_08500 [Verrucomicrobiaceae bacterium]
MEGLIFLQEWSASSAIDFAQVIRVEPLHFKFIKHASVVRIVIRRNHQHASLYYSAWTVLEIDRVPHS